jgi:hypothetical protein
VLEDKMKGKQSMKIARTLANAKGKLVLWIEKWPSAYFGIFGAISSVNKLE